MSVQPTQPERENLQRLLALANAEDLGSGDVTCALLPAGLTAEALFVAREEMVFCGGVFLSEIAGAYDAAICTDVVVGDGRRVGAEAVLARWSGPAAAMFSAERVALNFLQRLSGIATLTRRFVDAVSGSGAEILDTRKTTPGWREIEKYAVRCGGGVNHRRGLYDAVLVKDNHLAALAAGGCDDPLAALSDKLSSARARLGPGGFVEVEVDTLAQFQRALALPVDVILLDNFSAAELGQAVAARDGAGLKGVVSLEASGGVSLASAGVLAASGVERISVGALTHSAPAVDIGLDMDVR